MNRFSSLLYMTYFDFAVHYRKTMIGPLWVLMGPTLFIATLGLLFAEVSDLPKNVFIPHLAIGLIAWTLISGFVVNSTTVFQRNRSQIMQGGMTLIEIVIVDVMRTVLHFLHQIVIIVAIFFIYDLTFHWEYLISLLGLVLLVANGLWLTMFFGIVGARYRDLSEVVSAVMRIAFLATPIIWQPAERGVGGIMGVFLTYNPFYHFLDIVRAPMLGFEVTWLSFAVVGSLTVLGSVVSLLFYRKMGHRVALWV